MTCGSTVVHELSCCPLCFSQDRLWWLATTTKGTVNDSGLEGIETIVGGSDGGSVVRT